MSTSTNYDKITKFFIENDLEFSEEEPVATDLVKCWEVNQGEEKALVGALALAKRQGEFIIDGIAVEKVCRKLRVGKILLNKAIEETLSLGGKRIFLVARAPEFFRKSGFVTVEKGEAPNFFECLTCPQYGVDCHPEVMRLDLQ